MRPSYKYLTLIAALNLASCAVTGAQKGSVPLLPKVSSEPLCQSAVAEIRVDHPTASVSGCDVLSGDYFDLTIRPEKPTDPKGEVINNSPWYGFRVDPKQPGSVKFKLSYENGTHRYRPKVSYDGVNWSVLRGTTTPKPRPAEFSFNIKLDARPFYVSAQEIFSPKAHDVWTEK